MHIDGDGAQVQPGPTMGMTQEFLGLRRVPQVQEDVRTGRTLLWPREAGNSRKCDCLPTYISHAWRVSQGLKPQSRNESPLLSQMDAIQVIPDAYLNVVIQLHALLRRMEAS